MDDRLKAFLSRVPTANWREVPKVWNEQVRQAISDGYIGVGWGGVIRLTDAGRSALSSTDGKSP